jgi:hypothetical protein
MTEITRNIKIVGYKFPKYEFGKIGCSLLKYLNDAKKRTGKYPSCAAIKDIMDISRTSSITYAINLDEI